MKVKIYGILREINEAKYQQLCKIAHDQKFNTIEETIRYVQRRKK